MYSSQAALPSRRSQAVAGIGFLSLFEFSKRKKRWALKLSSLIRIHNGVFAIAVLFLVVMCLLAEVYIFIQCCTADAGGL